VPTKINTFLAVILGNNDTVSGHLWGRGGMALITISFSIIFEEFPKIETTQCQYSNNTKNFIHTKSEG
jgi:hypothetical protein